MPGKNITTNFMKNLSNFLPVLIGGGTGAVIRYLISLFVKSPQSGFPLATFIINVSGCFAIGVLYSALGAYQYNLKLFLMVGLLGGFTTFSAFGLETIGLLNNRHYFTAVFYVFLSNISALAAVYLGIKISF